MFGTEAQKLKYLPALASGEHVAGAFEDGGQERNVQVMGGQEGKGRFSHLNPSLPHPRSLRADGAADGQRRGLRAGAC